MDDNLRRRRVSSNMDTVSYRWIQALHGKKRLWYESDEISNETLEKDSPHSMHMGR